MDSGALFATLARRVEAMDGRSNPRSPAKIKKAGFPAFFIFTYMNLRNEYGVWFDNFSVFITSLVTRPSSLGPARRAYAQFC